MLYMLSTADIPFLYLAQRTSLRHVRITAFAQISRHHIHTDQVDHEYRLSYESFHRDTHVLLKVLFLGTRTASLCAFRYKQFALILRVWCTRVL